jgi:predicted metalloprotease
VRRFRALLLGLLVAVVVAACGTGAGGTSSGPEPASPTPTPSGTVGGASGDSVPSAVPCGGKPTCYDAPVEQQAKGAAPPGSESSGFTVEQYLAYMIGDLDGMWTKWFIDAGYSEPLVGYDVVITSETYNSQCTDRTTGQRLVIKADFPNAIYCPSDVITGSDGKQYQGVVVLPELTFQKMWSGNIFGSQSKVTGDFAAAILTAHEFGHHVADEMMIQSNTARPGSVAKPTGANNELIADCFAGVWMNTAYYSGMLEGSDVEEAVEALRAIGDRTVSNDPHGTPEERAAAVQLGYHGSPGNYAPGSPAACVATYWR